MSATRGVRVVGPGWAPKVRRQRVALARHRGTSKHFVAAYPAQAEAGLGGEGTLLGVDVLAGGAAFCWEPFRCYTNKVVSSPNVVVCGKLGKGKSGFVKLFLWRTLGNFASPDGSPMWAIVYDPKDEYSMLGEMLGMECISLHPGGTQRLNPLDPGPQVAVGDREALAECRTGTVGGLLGLGLGRRLSELEQSVVGWSITQLGERVDEPTLADLARLWRAPPREVCARADMDGPQIADAMRDAWFCLGRLLDGNLRGMFDGRSTVRLDRSPRGAVINLRSVLHDKPRLRTVMMGAQSWTQQLITAPGWGNRRWYSVTDEGWTVFDTDLAVQGLQAGFKLARDRGCSNIVVLHRLSDGQAQSPDGSIAAKVSEGLTLDCETRFLFAQEPGQVSYANDLLHLSDTESDLLPKMPQGGALCKIGQHTSIVQFVPTESEQELIATEAKIAL